jgi:hypothetical protein
MAKQARNDSRQWVALNCDCGAGGGQYLAHWELCRCKCGRMFWALQPNAGGPLVARHWPGSFNVGAFVNGFPGRRA